MSCRKINLMFGSPIWKHPVGRASGSILGVHNFNLISIQDHCIFIPLAERFSWTMQYPARYQTLQSEFCLANQNIPTRQLYFPVSSLCAQHDTTSLWPVRTQLQRICGFDLGVFPLYTPQLPSTGAFCTDFVLCHCFSLPPSCYIFFFPNA